MSGPALTLLVLRTAHLDEAREFYAALGLDFVAEQHGRGPVHYAAQLGATIFELYPQASGTTPALAALPASETRSAPETRLGFAVEHLEEVLAGLRALGGEVGPIQATPYGERALVRDPDGRIVEASRLPPT